MHDGQYGVSGKEWIINAESYPVDRTPRDDGVLHLTVLIPEESMEVLIPLDDDSQSILNIVDDEGSKTTFAIEPNLWYFSDEQFPIPRPPGVTKIPDSIRFDHPLYAELQCNIEIYNDDPLGQAKTEQAEDTNPPPLCS